MKKVGVIGYGYVGKGVTNFFKTHFDVVARDVNEEYHFAKGEDEPKLVSVDDKNNWSSLDDADLVVVSVPTPMGDDGSVDTSIVEDVLPRIKPELVLIKSTIPPGTTDMLIEKTGKKIAFSPEFMGEGGYVVQWWKDKGYPDPHDMQKHDFQIIGGEKEVTKAVVPFFQRVLGPEPKMMQTNAKTAELCKYMENAFIATKVTFCNEFYNMAETLGIDYNELRELWLLDGRVSRMGTAVFPDKRGFGGKCLPKDTNGIYKRLEKAGYKADFIKAVLDNNDRLKTNQD